MLSALLWTWLHLLIYASQRKAEAWRMKHPPLPTRSPNSPALFPCSHLSFLLVIWIQSPLDFSTSLLYLLHFPCIRLSLFCLISISIKTCPYYLPFNIPLTATYLLWLHVYAHLFNKQKFAVSTCTFATVPSVSWVHSRHTFSSNTLVLMSRVQTSVKGHLWDRGKWSGEGKRGACSRQFMWNNLGDWSRWRQSPMPKHSPNPEGGLRTRTELSPLTLRE